MKKTTINRSLVHQLFDNIDHQFSYTLIESKTFPFHQIPTFEEISQISNSLEKSHFNKRGIWTPSQEKMFNIIVFGICLENQAFPNNFTTQNWESVAKLFPYKNWKACRTKWFSEKSIKANWTFEEDRVLIDLYTKYPKKWCEIAVELMKICKTPYMRQGKQCRDRWVNKLDPNIVKDPWLKEEELRLFQEVKRKGKCWAEISLRLFNLRRTENAIKNRYYNLIKQEENKLKLGRMTKDEKENVILDTIITELKKQIEAKIDIKRDYRYDDTKLDLQHFKLQQFKINKKDLDNLEIVFFTKNKFVKLNN